MKTKEEETAEGRIWQGKGSQIIKMTLGPSRKRDKEKRATKGRKKLRRETQEPKTLYSSGFRGLQTKKSIRELDRRQEKQQGVTLFSMVRQLQGKTTHLSAFKHQGWLLHQSTKAHKRIAEKSNFSPNVRYVTCSSWKNPTIVIARIRNYPPPNTLYRIFWDSIFSPRIYYVIIKALVWHPFIKTSLY